MNIRRLMLLMIVFLASCGGGSDDPSSAVDGTWSGDLLQGVISCSDGTSIGAGSGLVNRSVELDITGSDEIGSVVQVSDGNCLFQGTRDGDGFRADAVAGCEQELDHIRFTVISRNEAGVRYHYDITKVPAGDNGVRCTITPSGIVNR